MSDYYKLQNFLLKSHEKLQTLFRRFYIKAVLKFQMLFNAINKEHPLFLITIRATAVSASEKAPSCMLYTYFSENVSYTTCSGPSTYDRSNYDATLTQPACDSPHLAVPCLISLSALLLSYTSLLVLIVLTHSIVSVSLSKQPTAMPANVSPILQTACKGLSLALQLSSTNTIKTDLKPTDLRVFFILSVAKFQLQLLKCYFFTILKINYEELSISLLQSLSEETKHNKDSGSRKTSNPNSQRFTSISIEGIISNQGSRYSRYFNQTKQVFTPKTLLCEAKPMKAAKLNSCCQSVRSQVNNDLNLFFMCFFIFIFAQPSIESTEPLVVV